MYLTKYMTIAIVSIGMVGCTQWRHPSATQADFQRDSYDCQNQANQANPRRYVPVQPAPQQPTPSYSTTCMRMGVMVSCESTPNPSSSYNPQMAQAQQSIAQGGADLGRAFGVSNFYDSCMYSKGYSK